MAEAAKAGSVAQAALSTWPDEIYRVLKDAGIVRGSVDGPNACYCLEPEAVQWLARFCNDICCPPGGLAGSNESC